MVVETKNEKLLRFDQLLIKCQKDGPEASFFYCFEYRRKFLCHLTQRRVTESTCECPLSSSTRTGMEKLSWASYGRCVSLVCCRQEISKVLAEESMARPHPPRYFWVGKKSIEPVHLSNFSPDRVQFWARRERRMEGVYPWCAAAKNSQRCQGQRARQGRTRLGTPSAF